MYDMGSSFSPLTLWEHLGWLPVAEVIELVTGWCMVCW
jgi:hypothetical protein